MMCDIDSSAHLIPKSESVAMCWQQASTSTTGLGPEVLTCETMFRLVLANRHFSLRQDLPSLLSAAHRPYTLVHALLREVHPFETV